MTAHQLQLPWWNQKLHYVDKQQLWVLNGEHLIITKLVGMHTAQGPHHGLSPSIPAWTLTQRRLRQALRREGLQGKASSI